jgi:hypothetical protein
MKKRPTNKNSIDRVAPSHEKNLAQMKLLASDSDFQRIVADVRKFLGLPPDGFDMDREPERIRNWWEEIHERSNEIQNSQRFRGLLDDIRKREMSGKIDAALAQKYRDLLYDKLPETHLTNVVRRIIAENKLPLNYDDAIRTYILSSHPIAPPFPFSIISSAPENLGFDPLKSVSFEAYADLTDEDFKSLRKQMHIFSAGRLPKSPKPIKNIDAKLMAEQLVRDRKRTASTGESYKMTAQEISETVKEEFGIDLKPEQINGIAREMENLRKKRFKDKSVK